MFYADYSADDFRERLLGDENTPTVGEYINKRMTLPAGLGGMGIVTTATLQQGLYMVYLDGKAVKNNSGACA